MKQINIEEYSDADINEVNAFLVHTENNLPKIENTKNMLLVKKNRAIIGIGATWINLMHPYRDYLSIYIDPAERNQGIGFSLFHEIERRFQLQHLQTFLSSNDVEAVSFAKKCGFSLARESYSYGMSQEKLKPFDAKSINEILSLNQLTPAQLEELLKLQYADYKQNHQAINPLSSEITLSEWRMIIFKDLVKEHSFVRIVNRAIVAYVLCYEADALSIELGYTGNRLENIKEYESFLYEVMLKLFENYSTVELEVDDCDLSAKVLKDLFIYKPTVSWDTYVK